MDEFSIAGSKLDSDLALTASCATLGNVKRTYSATHQAIVPSAKEEPITNSGWRDDKSKDNQENEPFYKTFKT